MNKKLTTLDQLRMAAEKSSEKSAQVARAAAEAIEELSGNKAEVGHTHAAAQVSFTPPSGMSAGTVQDAVSELFTSVSEGKALIAAAVTDKGVPTAADVAFQTMRDNIVKIPSGQLPANIRRIALSAYPADGGTVAGGGLTSVGMKVTVTATPKPGFDFVDWLEDDIYVTDHNTGVYTFSVNENRNLVAEFKKK